MTNRVCKVCGQTLPESKFKQISTTRDKVYRVRTCYACVYKKNKEPAKVHQRNYYLAHKEQCHARAAAWRKAHRAQYNLARKKRRLVLALEALRGKHG